jgi:glycosyltransferase involved in cell wall biosynthesis
MKFLIVSHTHHKLVDKQLFAYEPYVREMNLWTQYVTETRVVAPVFQETPRSIDAPYESDHVHEVNIPQVNFTSISKAVSSLFKLPMILYTIAKQCYWADHIHLRCPGNIGLLGCLVQIFFPRKAKTVKYAGNWDPNSNQPWSYRLQKRILSNTFLTRNCKVLVYGQWEGATKNIHPFFTASYSKDEIKPFVKPTLNKKLQFLFVGALTQSKQPILSVKAVEELIQQGFEAELNIYGNGVEYEHLKTYIEKNNLQEHVVLHGNQEKSVVKSAFQKAHFLIFLSKSEGWPKVVAEAMFWGCIPIASKVSCVPYMLGQGTRGALVPFELNEIVNAIKGYINNEDHYQQTLQRAQKWSQEYTMEYFSSQIQKLM